MSIDGGRCVDRTGTQSGRGLGFRWACRLVCVTAPVREAQRHVLWVLLLMALLASLACIEPADERAELDRRAGLASADGVSLRVADHLAAVRTMAEGEIELWAQSPVLELSFEVSETARQDWKLTVHNLMPSVIVERSAGLLSLSEESADSNTTRVWRFTLTPSSTGSLRLASPDAFEPGPFRIIYFSDLQEGIETWQVFSEALAAVPEVRFALFGGDLSNRGGAEEFERCAAALGELPFPVYQTPGNHDFGSSQELWSRYFGPHSFHFSYKGVGFSFADSASATLDASTYSRLQEWLRFPREAQHLFVTHYPLFDPVGTRNGAFRSRSEAAKLAGRLAAADVDLLLFGHVHSYYAFSVAQIPAFIAGGATSKLERMTGIGRHFLRLDIAEGGIDVSLMRIQE